MKKLTTLLFLVISMITNAQVKFIDREYFTVSIAVDPNATIKDGLNITPEIELVSYWKYVKVNTQIQPSLEGGYIDFTGGFGMNITSGNFNQWRAYTGIRLGHIRRGEFGYPLAGLEAGIDINLTKSVFIGARCTYDHRSDFKFSGAVADERQSTTVRIGTSF